MDTRIEVLTEVICDHAKQIADRIMEAECVNRGYKYHAYRKVENLCVEIFTVLHEYRVNHPQEYETVRRVSRSAGMTQE